MSLLSQRIASSYHSQLRSHSLHSPRMMIASTFLHNFHIATSINMNQTFFLFQQLSQQQQQQQPKRHFSDNLLGYSPMAPQNNTNKNMKKSLPTEKETNHQGPIVGVDANTIGGGVWAQTSSKRTKLGELNMELKFDLGQRSLDDVATEEEKYDLFLIDGVSAVVHMVDNGGFSLGGEQQQPTYSQEYEKVWSQLQCIMKEFQDSIIIGAKSSKSYENLNVNGESIEINKEQFEQLLSTLLQYITEQREKHSAAPNGTNNPKIPPSALLNVRDFLLYKPPNPDEPIPLPLRDEMYKPISKPYMLCLEYFQMTLLQSALEYFMTQWDNLTQLSSGDQDRAAVRGDSHTTTASMETINLSKLCSVVNAFGSGSCADRVEMLWNLLDRDNDSMLDQQEMDRVVYMSIAPMEDALKKFIVDTIDTWPMRTFGLPPPCLEQKLHDADTDIVDNKMTGKKIGFFKRWKEQRLEKQAKRTLMKLLDRTVKNHFEIEAETPHRLRCIYAWAEKKHQDGKTESVLVEATNNNNNETGPGGFFSSARKRYVELDPKISYSEFRAEQIEHFPHLDKVGQELCTSLKEDLWIYQGKGREKQQLKREITAFLAIVSLIDYAIITH